MNVSRRGALGVFFALLSAPVLAIPGDVTGDGWLSIADVIRSLRMLVGLEPLDRRAEVYNTDTRANPQAILGRVTTGQTRTPGTVVRLYHQKPFGVHDQALLAAEAEFDHRTNTVSVEDALAVLLRDQTIAGYLATGRPQTSGRFLQQIQLPDGQPVCPDEHWFVFDVVRDGVVHTVGTETRRTADSIATVPIQRGQPEQPATWSTIRIYPVSAEELV